MTHKIQLGTYTDNPKDEATRRHVAKVLCEAVGCNPDDGDWGDDLRFIGIDGGDIPELVTYILRRDYDPVPRYIPLSDFLKQWPMPGQMRLIRSADELEEGKFYWIRSMNTIFAQVMHRNYLPSDSFIDANEKYQIFGPIPEPNWDAVLGEEG